MQDIKILLSKDRLHEKIEKKSAKICVIGLGQVGLPTALTFNKVGFSVIGHDINHNLLSTINSKKAPFEEEGLESLLKESIENGRFNVTSDINQAVPHSDVIIVCVATPITENIKPDLSALEKVCTSLSKMSLKDKLVIIESSLPPGTFDGLIIPLLEKQGKTGIEYWAAFVPERLSPGQGLTEIQSTPRLIGFRDQDSGFLARSLYENMVHSQIFLTSSLVAEVSKLVENTYRDVNVAFANEVGLICEEYGIDVADLIKVCNTHPRVKLLQPGPGVGGPCLPKDPYLLLNPQGHHEIESKIISNSRKINDSMPHHVVNLVREALNLQNKLFMNSTVTVLGVAYKANVSDTRFSPAKEIITQLIKDGCQVIVHDPKTRENFGGNTIDNVNDAISSCDALLIITDHNEFKELNLIQIKKIMKNNPILVDTKRIFSKNEAENLGFQYVSVGYTRNLKHK